MVETLRSLSQKIYELEMQQRVNVTEITLLRDKVREQKEQIVSLSADLEEDKHWMKTIISSSFSKPVKRDKLTGETEYHILPELTKNRFGRC